MWTFFRLLASAEGNVIRRNSPGIYLEEIEYDLEHLGKN